jgi:hypothetical protein
VITSTYGKVCTYCGYEQGGKLKHTKLFVKLSIIAMVITMAVPAYSQVIINIPVGQCYNETSANKTYCAMNCSVTADMQSCMNNLSVVTSLMNSHFINLTSRTAEIKTNVSESILVLNNSLAKCMSSLSNIDSAIYNTSDYIACRSNLSIISYNATSCSVSLSQCGTNAVSLTTQLDQLRSNFTSAAYCLQEKENYRERAVNAEQSVYYYAIMGFVAGLAAYYFIFKKGVSREMVTGTFQRKG